MRLKSSVFTMVELLTVIAILAILMSMLMPSLSKALKRARALSCLTNLQGWGGAIESYANDYDDYYPGYTFRELNDRFTTWEQIGGGGGTGPYQTGNAAVQAANLRAFMTYLTPEAPVCVMRTEPRDPSYRSWGLDRSWSVQDYFSIFGRGHMNPSEPDNLDGWTRSYWTAALAQQMGPTWRRVTVRKEATPLMWDRTWIQPTYDMDVTGCDPGNCGYYWYGANYNKISNHSRSGGRMADNANVLLLDGSAHNMIYSPGDAAWMYYGRDYYNRFWLHEDIMKL